MQEVQERALRTFKIASLSPLYVMHVFLIYIYGRLLSFTRNSCTASYPDVTLPKKQWARKGERQRDSFFFPWSLALRARHAKRTTRRLNHASLYSPKAYQWAGSGKLICNDVDCTRGSFMLPVKAETTGDA